MEIHGNGEAVDHRYEYSDLPTCTSSAACHQNLNTSASTAKYHYTHLDDFNCHVCHSQNYNTCGSCHIHGDGARIGPIQDFKIALNPLADENIPNHNTEFALVRRTLAAPDNWDVYLDSDYSNFEAFPTFNYTTPHNIKLITARTVENATYENCMINCHIRNEGGELINEELYLWSDSLIFMGSSGNRTYYC